MEASWLEPPAGIARLDSNEEVLILPAKASGRWSALAVAGSAKRHTKKRMAPRPQNIFVEKTFESERFNHQDSDKEQQGKVEQEKEQEEETQGKKH